MDQKDHADLHEIASTVSEARLASVFGTAVDGIIVINEKGQILAFNQACETLFGYKAAELLGRNVNKIMPQRYATAHDGYINNYRETGERRIIGIGREVEARHKDGTEFPIELSVGEAATAEGRQFIGILRDLRAKKAVETKLAEAQAQLVNMTRISALDEMGAAIAHELNQPLTAMMLYLQTISKKVRASDGEAPVISIIDKAIGEVERAGDIIQRMRYFVEKKEPEREEIDAAELCRECIDLVKLGASEDRVAFVMNARTDLAPLHVDPVQIRQVLVNLLRNAREAVGKSLEKQVTVDLVQDGEVTEFRIHDTGPGVPDHLRSELFRAFSGGKKKGLGLGLAISRSIAQNHGGDLYLDQDGTGGGATFVLKLPINRPKIAEND